MHSRAAATRSKYRVAYAPVLVPEKEVDLLLPPHAD